MVGSTLNTQVAYAIVLCRPSEAVNCYAYSDLTGGKTASQRKSSRAEVTSLGNGKAALGPACYFSAFLRLLTNSASQPWAPSAGLSPCQRLKATQGLALQLSLFHRGRELMLCSAVGSGVRSELFPITLLMFPGFL